MADIVGKCILCKDTAYDTASELQLKFMSAIVMKKKIGFGEILIDWLFKWIEDARIKNVEGKTIPKMYCGRFRSIILKKRLKSKIGDEEGEVLNCNKRITPRLFKDLKKNP